MSITLKPETERMVEEKLQSGHFHSVDEIIVQRVRALREKRQSRRKAVRRLHELDLVQELMQGNNQPYAHTLVRHLIFIQMATLRFLNHHSMRALVHNLQTQLL